MRISLRWMLLLVTYVAIAVAAGVQQGLALRAALWVGNVFAILYSLLAAGFFRGQGQAIAVGFALFSIVGVLFNMGFPIASPVPDMIRPMTSSSVVSADELLRLAQRAERLAWEMQVSSEAGSSEYRSRAQREYTAAQRRLNRTSSFEALVSVIEASFVMICGVVGCFVGNHIWKLARRVAT